MAHVPDFLKPRGTPAAHARRLFDEMGNDALYAASQGAEYVAKHKPPLPLRVIAHWAAVADAAKTVSWKPPPTLRGSRHYQELAQNLSPYAAGGDPVYEVSSNLYGGHGVRREALREAAEQLERHLVWARREDKKDVRNVMKLIRHLRNLYANAP